MGFLLKANSGKGDGNFEKAPPGNHPAVCVAIVDLGTQRNDFQDKDQHKVYFAWELVSEPMSGYQGRNHIVGTALTFSLNEKATLRKWIEARAGKPIPEGTEYDIINELGKPCLLTVIHTEKGYVQIQGISSVPKGMQIPGALVKPFGWAIDDQKDLSTIKLPDWLPYLYGEPLENVIRRSKELTGNQSSPRREPASAAARQPEPEPEQTPW